MPIRFTALASGSRGNSALIRAGGIGTLIDLGLPRREMTLRLAQAGCDWRQIGAVLLTHTHGDHIQKSTLRDLADRGIPLYCHERHRLAMKSEPAFLQLDAAGLVRHYDPDRAFLSPSGVQVEPIELSHDGGPTFGFRVEGRGARGEAASSIGYVADSGTWNRAIADALTDVHLLGVEFNHDVDLQRKSGRPWHLIARNLGDRGHLSNDQAAALVRTVLDQSALGSLRDVVLLHLSEHCNEPTIALKSARAAVKDCGKGVAVHAASQYVASPDLVLRKPVRSRRKATAGSGPYLAGFPWETPGPAVPTHQIEPECGGLFRE